MFFSVDYPNEEAVMLKPQETFVDDDFRIKFLKEHFLKKIIHKDGWQTLWLDPKDKRYWEKTRFFGHTHGGGYPFLHNIPENTARMIYGDI